MPSLLELLHAIPKKMAPYGRFRTTAAAADSDHLISSGFVNSTLAGTSLEGMYVLIEDGPLAGQQAPIRDGSGVVKTTGVVNLAADLAGNVGDAVWFSVYGRFPPLTTSYGRGWDDLFGEALARIPVRDRVTLTAASDLKHYPISSATYPWWTSPGDVIAVYHPVASADDVATPYTGRWHWEDDGETRYLVFPGAPWRTGQNPSVAVYRPASSRLRQDGIWTDQTSETATLTSLDDETLASVGDVEAVTRAYAYRALADRQAPGQTVAEWMAKADQWEIKAVRRLSRRRQDVLTGIPNLAPVRAYAGRSR